MKRDPAPQSVHDDLSVQSVFTIFKTVGDTTWRMFVPVILGACLGLWVDGQFGTNYSAIVGSIVGLVLAGLLVWRQYVDVTKGSNT